jgi:hypothetical protein
MPQLPGYILELTVNADGTANIIIYVGENAAQKQNTALDLLLTAGNLSGLGTAAGAGEGTTNFVIPSRVSRARTSGL